MINVRRHFLPLLLASLFVDTSSGEEPRLAGTWKRNGLAVERFEIQGTGGRNNPLRRQLARRFSGDELFVRFRLRYNAESIDTLESGDGEFFVLWLDETEGGDASTHSGGVPNIGVHVHEGQNRFMVRYAPRAEQFGPPLIGDQDFLLVGRLTKSVGGEGSSFDRFDLWVDPAADAQRTPVATVRNLQAIPSVSWVGISTGAKTEFEDRVMVWDIDVASTWESILGLPAKSAEPTVPAPKQRTIEFATHVLPILQSKCFACHAGDEAEEGIRLDVVDEVLNRIAPRDADDSQLIQLVESGKMPPEGPLAEDEIHTLRTWINEGLDWDEDRLPTPVPKSDHWAFRTIRRPRIPQTDRTEWIRTPVDAFVLRQHEEAGLVAAPPADRETLQRRLSLDLLGLPPKFLSTKIDLDELLASRRHGERWARHWLDVARWAESNGHQHNRDRPHAWRYRDWLIGAFSEDMPFDRFLLAQIAGDELEGEDPRNIVATGFLAAARYSGNELDKSIQRNDILVDVANTTANVFLGLTLECAQCHTHKFDPLTLRDYYRFQAFFAQGQPGNVVIAGDSNTKSVIDERWEIYDRVYHRMVSVRRRRGDENPSLVMPKSVVGGMKADEKARFKELESRIEKYPQSWSFYAPETAGRKRHVAPHEMRWPLPRHSNRVPVAMLIRGDVESRGPEMLPGWPGVFGETPNELPKPRTALARWMTDRSNPLTARVWVNRIWQWHFGRGLVESSGDFGTQGTEPTHPQLLDFLASELLDNGWSTHHIHRLIVDSATYRQSSRLSPENAAIDPDNRLLWRWTPRRLEAEAIRDCILAVSGKLSMDAGGPGTEAESKRRSIYLRQRRDNFPYQQLLFDSSTGITSCSRRRVSTTSLQPLWLMNSKTVQEAAQSLAERAGSISESVRLCLGREPSPAEVRELKKLSDDFGLASVCLALLNSSEFLYIP